MDDMKTIEIKIKFKNSEFKQIGLNNDFFILNLIFFDLIGCSFVNFRVLVVKTEFPFIAIKEKNIQILQKWCKNSFFFTLFYLIVQSYL